MFRSSSQRQQSKILVKEKKSLGLKSSSVAPDSRPTSKNGRKVNVHGSPNVDVESPQDKDPRDVVRELLQVSLARIFEGVFSKEEKTTSI